MRHLTKNTTIISNKDSELLPRLSNKKDIESFLKEGSWKNRFVEGMAFNNWTTFETYLGLEPSLKGTNIKNKYIKILEKYMDWERVKGTNGIVITTIFDEPALPTETGKYTEHALSIVAESLLLVCDAKGFAEVVLTYDELFHWLGMVDNEYFAITQPNSKALSEEANLLLEYIDIVSVNKHCKLLAYQRLKTIVSRVRQSLVNDYKISWAVTYKIMYSDSNTYTVANPMEDTALSSCITKLMDGGMIPFVGGAGKQEDAIKKFKKEVIKLYNTTYADSINYKPIKTYSRVHHIYSSKTLLDKFTIKINSKANINATILATLQKSLDTRFSKSWQFDGEIEEYIELLTTKMAPVGKTKQHHEIDKNIMDTKVSTKKYFQFTREELM